MLPVTQTTSITIEDTNYEVSSLSPESQYIVQLIDSARQDEVEAYAALMKARAALADFQNKLLQDIQTSVAPLLTEEPTTVE
jgi:hypothetical protein